MKSKVCHLTSVHLGYDIRVFYKECKSLARAGYEVVLIARHKKDEPEMVEGIRIIPFPPFKNRLFRILLAPLHMFFLAIKQGAGLYHFHDPELIITGLLLRLFTRAKVVYDIHEDFKTSISQKYYLSKGIALVISGLFGLFETTASKFFKLVLAEKYYKERFPKGIHVLNYPLSVTSCWHDPFSREKTSPPGSHREKPLPTARTLGNQQLLYTGIIAKDRGALLHARMLTYLKDVDLTMVGFCRKIIARQMRQIAGDQQDRLHLEGEEEFVPPSRIHYYYERGKWLAGLALFPPTSHYMKKELTKFFEYMSAGIPIICSDFPVWRQLVRGVGAGLLVDPFDQQAIVSAVEFLQTHPDKAIEMGEKGKKAVLEKYNWDKEEKKLLDLYQQII